MTRRRPRVRVFSGPSLSAAEIQSRFASVKADVEVLAPAQQGDVLRLMAEPPDVIGIVDGYFFHVPSVLHREILLALERGVRVLGSSSLGALRAAELDVFGMEGVGEIYGLYRRGAIDGDDEVAVLHATADEGFRPLTEALVNLRHSLRVAQRRRLVSARTATRVLAHAKRLPFMQRTSRAILTAATGRERVALAGFLRGHAVDLKRRDAMLLVDTIARRVAGQQPWPRRAPLEVRRTSLFQRYEQKYVGQRIGGEHVPDHLTLALLRILSPSFPALHQRVSLRCLALDEAAHLGLTAADARTAIGRLRRARGLRSNTAYRAWLQRRLLTHEELAQLLRERELEERIVDRYRSLRPGVRGRAALLRCVARDVAARYGVAESALTRPLLMRPGVPWTGPLIREIKERGAFRPAATLAARILEHNSRVFDRLQHLAQAPIRRGLLDELVARRWGVELDQLGASALERGFAGDADFVQAARYVFVYERTVPVRSDRDWDGFADCFVHL
jgi:hypothetical protein